MWLQEMVMQLSCLASAHWLAMVLTHGTYGDKHRWIMQSWQINGAVLSFFFRKVVRIPGSKDSLRNVAAPSSPGSATVTPGFVIILLQPFQRVKCWWYLLVDYPECGSMSAPTTCLHWILLHSLLRAMEIHVQLLMHSCGIVYKDTSILASTITLQGR